MIGLCWYGLILFEDIWLKYVLHTVGMAVWQTATHVAEHDVRNHTVHRFIYITEFIQIPNIMRLNWFDEWRMGTKHQITNGLCWMRVYALSDIDFKPRSATIRAALRAVRLPRVCLQLKGIQQHLHLTIFLYLSGISFRSVHLSSFIDRMIARLGHS